MKIGDNLQFGKVFAEDYRHLSNEQIRTLIEDFTKGWMINMVGSLKQELRRRGVDDD